MKRNALYPLMFPLVQEMQLHPSAWPFLQPVQGVADYYELVKDPMGRLWTSVGECGLL